MRPPIPEHLPLQYLPNFVVAPPGSLPIYMILESELEALEHGSPDSKFLNLGVALISAGVSLGATLLATPWATGWIQALFIACAMAGLANGSLLIYLWRRSGEKVAILAQKIRQRLPSDDYVMETVEGRKFTHEIPSIDEK